MTECATGCCRLDLSARRFNGNESVKGHVLITGAAGFLGHRAADRVTRAGFEVVAVDLFPRGRETLSRLLGTNGTSIECDVRDEKSLSRIVKEYSPVACVHLAAKVGEKVCNADPGLAVAVNREAAGQVARTCRNFGCRKFILSSTCSVYGISRDKPVRETDIASPISVYGESKLDAEGLVLAEADPDFTVVVFRLSTLFGLSARMRFDLTVNQFAAEAHFENHLDIYSGRSKRPYLHVDDAARAMAWCTTERSLDSGIYNLGDSRLNYSKNEIVDLVHNHWPGTEITDLGQGTDCRNYVVDFAKIARQGFAIRTDVAAGLAGIHKFLSGLDAPIDFRSEEYAAV